MNKAEFLLKNVSFFHGLNLDDLKLIAPLLTERKYKKNSIIFFEGDEGHEFYIVKSGSVKIYRQSETKEIILRIFRSGDYFGEMALLQQNQVRSTTAETLEPSELWIMKKDEFVKLLEQNPNMLLKLLDVYMDRLRKANDMIENLTFLDVRSRIIKLIIDLYKQYGTDENGTYTIDLKITHQQMAHMAGTGRETVTKVLSELQDKHFIHVENKKIIVRRLDRLQEMIQSV